MPLTHPSSLCHWCGAVTSEGLLCPSHQGSLRQSVTITAEQIQTSQQPEKAFHLIDCFGTPHDLGAHVDIGRDPTTTGIAILHHSVSLAHAHIEKPDIGETLVIDRGSLNGTFVNGEQIAHPTALFDGDVVQFAQIAFYYAKEISIKRERAQTVGGTIRVDTIAAPFVTRLMVADTQTELIEKPPGGLLRSECGTVNLSKMEFSLLRVLAQDLLENDLLENDTGRDYLPSRVIATALDFQSIDAGSDNVRELVKRIRRKVKAIGIGQLITSRPRHGYRLAATILP